MSREKKESDLNNLLGGSLNILGFKLDLGDMLSSPENLAVRLEELREKLKAAGGKEVLSNEEWNAGGVSVSGHVRVRGLMGDEEFHIGTMGNPRSEQRTRTAPEPPEVVEPPVDVFYEDEQVTIVADVPGVSEDDIDLKVEGKAFRLSTKDSARRSYHKELQLEAEIDPESLQSSCHNGVLQVHLSRR